MREERDKLLILKKIILFIVLLFTTAGIGLLCWLFWILRGKYDNSKRGLKKSRKANMLSSNTDMRRNGIAQAR